MFDGGGATEAIAAGIAERPAGEDDEGLRVAAEVAVPAALALKRGVPPNAGSVAWPAPVERMASTARKAVAE